jgi:SMI1/KNR4 family protein SUKH-1
MRPSDERLIQRLQERNADRERATDGGIHPRKRIPPVAAKVLQVAERAIGFKLPQLLRAIYLKIGNGGFGPEYGIVGTKGGAKLDGCTLEACYRNMLKLEKENPVWRWPQYLLPVANYGCGMWSCVDCSYQKLPMVLWDPNNLDADLDGADARLNWGNSFWDQGLSLKTWLEGWLAEEQQPEPKWPSDAWMRKRLGFRLPK